LDSSFVQTQHNFDDSMGGQVELNPLYRPHATRLSRYTLMRDQLNDGEHIPTFEFGEYRLHIALHIG